MSEEGRRVEKVEYGLRTVADTTFHRKGYVEDFSSLERAVHCRDQPFTGRRGDEQVVTRTIVTYTTNWTAVPGHDGSPHFSCGHDNTPYGWQDRDGDRLPPWEKGPDYQLPHPYRERDMTRGEDGIRRYTCPVCSLTWRHRADAEAAQNPLF